MSVCSSSRIRAWWYESHVATCNVVYDSKVPELCHGLGSVYRLIKAPVHDCFHGPSRLEKPGSTEEKTKTSSPQQLHNRGLTKRFFTGCYC